MPAYVPTKKPRARDLAKFAAIYDDQTFTDIVRARFKKASLDPSNADSYFEALGECAAVEIDGDLHVKGHFDVGRHRISALLVHGNLIVDGTYSDPSDEQTLVIVEGDLRAHAIVTGAQLEVHRNVKTRHLAGDYNDYVMTVHGDVDAVTFFPENHHFELKKPPHFELVIGDDASYRVPDEIRAHIKTVPNGSLEAYLKKGFVDEGDIDSDKIYKTLRAGNDILSAEPSTVVPELAIFSPGVRAKMATPETVTSVSLTNRDLTALPPKLLECVNLTSINLEDNDLTDLCGIGKFEKLKKLNLDSNAMSKLPDEMRTLTELRSLSLRYTKNLADLPDWMSELTKLEEMWITMSALKKIPRVLAKMPALRKLNVWHFFDVNPKVLEGTIAAIGEMKLTHLAFLQGNIKTLPRDLTPLAKIGVIKIWDLGLTREEKTRIATALPKAQIDSKNILL